MVKLKPKIFISHSAKEDRARRVKESLYTALTAAGFDVFLDKYRIDDGGPWRDEITRWLWQSHAAVLLLSEHALASPWVKKEIANLTWRRDLSRQFGNPLFEILPVLLDPVDRAMIDGLPDFSPFAVNEIQAVPADSDEQIVERIVAKMMPLHERFGERAAFGKLRYALVAILDKVKRDEVLEATAKALGVDIAEAGAGDKRMWLAERMLQADFTSLREAVQIVGPFTGRENARELSTITAPFCWVDQHAAERIPEVIKKPERERVICLNTEDAETAVSYVRRACSEYPAWTLRPVGGGHSADRVDDLTANVREIIKSHLGYLPEDDVSDNDLNTELGELVTADKPFIILIGAPLPAREVVELAVGTFPVVTFIFLTGQINSLEFKDLGLRRAEFLLPELDPRQERRAKLQYKEVLEVVQGINII